MAYSEADHTWLVCAYKESPYLEECIRSLREQTVKSRIQISTATPNAHIDGIARKYGLPVIVNDGQPGIGTDWNFALEHGKTELLTIAHQDDIYEPEYTQEMLKRINRASRPILYFTDYMELRNGNKVRKDRLLRIKRLMLIPTRLFPAWKRARWLSLAFGNPICCPSVTYIRTRMEGLRFGTRFQSNLDWEMTERLSRQKGQFVYCPIPMMCHRIHEESATSGLIGENKRTQEDYEMMRKFWPDRIAKRLSRVYASSEKSNQV